MNIAFSEDLIKDVKIVLARITQLLNTEPLSPTDRKAVLNEIEYLEELLAKREEVINFEWDKIRKEVECWEPLEKEANTDTIADREKLGKTVS